MNNFEDTLPNTQTSFNDANDLNLRELLGTLLRYWKSILLLTLLGTLVGAYLAYVAPPVYATNALLHVENQKRPGLSDIDAMMVFAMRQSLSPAELEIVRSRSIISGAVELLNLDIDARPQYFGKIGAAYARRNTQRNQLTPPPFPGLSEYAWGGEKINVSRFSVPGLLLEKTFFIKTGENNSYQLFSPNNTLLAEGKVEEPILVAHDLGTIELYLNELIARPGTRFTLTKHEKLNVVNNMQEQLHVQERGMRSGIIELKLEGTNPGKIRDKLNALANNYLRNNVEKQSEEAKQVLDFLSQQLPVLKQNVDASEAKLRSYQSKQGTIDLSLEAGSLLEKLTIVQQKQSELKLQLAELKQKYTDNHPLVKSLSRKLAQANGDLSSTEKELKKLPATESAFLKLKRDVVVANELYLQLLNRYQELKVVKAGITGFVRIIDRAYLPKYPVSPQRLLLLLTPIVVSFLLGIMFALGRHALRHKLETPEILEGKLGLPTYATVPYSQKQNALERMRHRRENRKKLVGAQVLARLLQQDLAVESLRSLRTSLQFALLESDSNIVTITGPTPEIGKSFVAENLAYLLAETGQKTLLIDADMRLGHLNHNLIAKNKPGLSDFITQSAAYEEVVQTIEPNGLCFIACGTRPPNPAELLVNSHFKELLKRVSADFDIVIIDTPPILTMTDGIVVAQASGSCLLVARAGTSTLHEVEIAAKRLRQNKVPLKGVIMNGMTTGALGYGYGYGAYQKYGKSKYHPHETTVLQRLWKLIRNK